MTRPMTWTVLAILCVALPLAATAAPRADDDARLANWHQLRGPTGNGTAPAGDPPTTWSATENVRWKVAIPGQGQSTPIVWGDRVFVTTAVATAGTFPAPDAPYEFVVLCLDRATGEERWRQVAVKEKPHEGVHKTASYAAPTPVTDGKRLYVSFGSRGVFCYDLDGKELWKRDLGDKTIRRSFGEGSSLVVDGESLIQLWDHEGPSFVYCLDARSGKTRWKVERDESSTWSTPLIVTHDGVIQVVVNGSNRVRSYDITDGKLLWACGGQTRNPIPAPMTADGVLYAASGFRGNAVYAIPLDARGDITDSGKVIWKTNEAGPYVASPLLYDGLLYVTKERTAILTVLDAKTGKVHYLDQRLPGMKNIYASLVGAAGKVFITGRNGTTLVLKHAESFEVLASNDLGEPVDASPVIVGKELFLRGRDHLYCIAEKE